VKPVEVEEEELLVEEEELLDEDDDEEEVVEPKPKRRRKKVVEVEPEPESEEYEEEEEVEPAPRKRRRKKVVEVEPEPESEEAAFSSADLFEAILGGLSEGQSVTITASEDEWVLSAGGETVAAPKVTLLKGRAYHDEVLAEEFLDWREKWQELTFSEKKAQAKKAKAEWDEHEDPRVEAMRIAAAIREALGIEKYKPEYRTRAARAAIRG